MTKKAEISQDNFEKLLDWLHSDRETAGQIYETIRNRLVKIFYARGYSAAEEMADETIDRVAKKSKALSETYQGEPSRYFYAVAKNISLEYSRKPKFEELPVILVKEETANEQVEIYHQCLDKCLTKMPSNQHQLIIEYYQGEKQAKIKQRKLIEMRMGIPSQTLRVRVLRMRKILQECVSKCVQENFC